MASSSIEYFGVARSSAEIKRAFVLRRAVFCVEQGVSEEAEFDGLDEGATHVVGVIGAELVATCRLLMDDDAGRLGRMAVARSARRTGVGHRLLATAEEVTRESGASKIVLHAQRQAETFYAACGFRAEGSTFIEEGIPHVLMRKSLAPR